MIDTLRKRLSAHAGDSAKTVSLIEMSVQARWNSVPRLIGVPGVANVSRGADS